MTNPSLKNLKTTDIAGFQQDLIDWFTENHRSLPWRETRNPYYIWVSEIMLQQTKVDTVIPYYQNFTTKFPTIDTFAEADEEDVLKAWEGLGYYSRVRNLHTAVKEVKEKYEGTVPNTYAELSALKGIGPYTAGAILSIAFGIPMPAVDGNVMRVLSRILLISEDIAKPAARKTFEEAVRHLISEENPSYFNQALMELGALICTPTTPSCLLCPVREHCHAFEQGLETTLPVKSKKKKGKTIPMIAGVMQDKNGKILIRKRPNTGLLADLWEFPNLEKTNKHIASHTFLEEYLAEQYQVSPQIEEVATANIKHVFTHLTWDIEMFVGEINGVIMEDARTLLVTEDALTSFAFSVSHQKIWEHYINQKHRAFTKI